MKKFLISFVVSILVFVVIFTVFGDKFARDDRPIGADEVNKIVEKEEDKFIETEDNKIERKHPDELVFALFGLDSNLASFNKKYNETLNSNGLRSDVIIVAKLNFKTGKIDMLSVPRDTRVLVKGRMDKINAAHAYGGSKLAMRTLREFLGVDIDYYVKINFDGVIKIVDAIGGMDFEVPVDMNYDDPTAVPPLRIHMKKGVQHLDGQKSHDVLRFRHNNGQDYYPGGFIREQVQLDWLKEFVKQALKPKSILNLPTFIESYIDYVDTNIPFLTLIDSAWAARKLDLNNIETKSIETKSAMIDGIFYFVPNEENVKSIVDEMFGDYKLENAGVE